MSLPAMQLHLSGKSLAEIAIERLRQFEPAALERQPEQGYWLAHSGGKDSVVLFDLATRAGVKFRAVHNLTTCDPPELVQFIKQQPGVEISPPPMSMWVLIRKNGMPPRRNARYCCKVLKERGGADSVVLTGVRWAESTRRQTRKMAEPCYRDKTKSYLHPIIDWSTASVWAYIRERELPYCRLYDEGFRRVGCVLCPCHDDVTRDMRRWPHVARAWERAIKATYKPHGGCFRSPDEYWRWWINRHQRARCAADPAQNVLFEDDPSYIDTAFED